MEWAETWLDSVDRQTIFPKLAAQLRAYVEVYSDRSSVRQTQRESRPAVEALDTVLSHPIPASDAIVAEPHGSISTVPTEVTPGMHCCQNF